MRRSLRLRLLGLSLAVASFAVVAMALLATYGTGSQLREEIESDTSLLETDSEIRTALLAHANDHAGWDGVDRLVQDLAERTGRRIALTTPGGETIADSAELLGQGSSDLPSVPTARIDATRTPPSTARVDARPGQVVELQGTVHLQGWRLTPSEEARRRALADGAEACLAGVGVDATISVDGATHVVSRAGDGAGDTVGGLAGAAPDLRDHPCIPDEIYAPSAAAVELNGETVELVTACLDDHGLAHELATDTYGLEVVQPADGTGTPPAWTDCVEAGRAEAKRPYVAPAADLYLGTSDRFDPFSPDGWRRTAATTLAVLLAAAAVTVLAGRRLVRPIAALTAAAQRMAAGDHTARVPAPGSGAGRSRDEVARLGQAFNAMAESVETHDRQRKALVNDVAHELRTPLANVRSHLEAAEDGVVELDLDLIRSLHEESELLERLVADLHDLALADAGMLRIHPEERDAADIAAQAVAGHRARAEAAGLALTLRVGVAGAGAVAGGPVPVLADPGRLRQALGNLVSNAITHTPAGGSVTVGVGVTPGPGAPVVLTVADTGPGIAAEHLAHVFDRFYRADPSRSRTTGGSGLGLAITKHLAEAHGGAIDVASTPGEGTTFTLRLPAPPPPR